MPSHLQETAAASKLTASGTKNMGAYSSLLVDLMERRTNTTTAERLQRPTRQLKQSTLQDLEEEVRSCHTSSLRRYWVSSLLFCDAVC